jgi:hypothetical protein
VKKIIALLLLLVILFAAAPALAQDKLKPKLRFTHPSNLN